MDPILALHANNAEQWNAEDDARREGADDAVVAAAKRTSTGSTAPATATSRRSTGRSRPPSVLVEESRS